MPLRVLIIDDEPLARQELQFLLESTPEVEVAGLGGNGIEAVELIRKHRPDVVFLDVQMPGLDGFGVIKKLLETKVPPAPGGLRHSLRSLRRPRLRGQRRRLPPQAL